MIKFSSQSTPIHHPPSTIHPKPAHLRQLPIYRYTASLLFRLLLLLLLLVVRLPLFFISPNQSIKSIKQADRNSSSLLAFPIYSCGTSDRHSSTSASQRIRLHQKQPCSAVPDPGNCVILLPDAREKIHSRAMDPSTAGGGQQQQRGQQPAYDIRQGGHYGTSSINLRYISLVSRSEACM